MKGLKLSRGANIAVNVVLTLVFCAGIWLNKGAPYPTAMMELRRMERQNLLPPSQIVYLEDSAVGVGADMVGLGKNWVVSATYRRFGSGHNKYISVFPKREGPMPIPLPSPVEVMVQPGEKRWCNALVVIQIPEDAAQAQLDVDWKDWRGAVEGIDGELRDNGVFFFWFDPDRFDAYGETMGTSWSFGQGNYSLRLYDTDGALLSEHTGYISDGLYTGHFGM